MRFSRVLFCGALMLAGVSSCVKMPRRARQSANSLTTVESAQFSSAPRAALVNLNTATRAELEKLPGIGEGLAARIVEHREQYGAFRRIEHLIMVRGISERRFEQLRAFVTVN